MPTLTFVVGWYSSPSHSCWVKSRTFLSGSKKPQLTITCQNQLSTAKPGAVTAPSRTDSSRSTTWSMSMVVVWPSPLHSAHMPSVLLKLNAVEVPMCGVPSRL